MSEDFSAIKNKLQATTKKIIKEAYAPKPETRLKHLIELINTNNSCVDLLRTKYNSYNRTDRINADNLIEHIRKRFVDCVAKLECTGEIPEDLYSPIPINALRFKNDPERQIQLDFEAGTSTDIDDSGDSDTSDPDTDSESTKASITDTQSQISFDVSNNPLDISNFPPQSSTSTQQQVESSQTLPSTKEVPQPQTKQPEPSNTDNNDVNKQNNAKMSMTKIDIMRMCNSQISTAYAGNPNDLESFIDSISLLDELIDDKSLLVKIVKTKLTSKAREVLLTTDNTVAKIIASLRKGIAQESSKVVEGRMANLQVSANCKLDEFSKKVEELAESLQRSLIAEKFPEEKARQLAVEKTVEVCRLNSRSDVIKAVLSSPAGFKNPQEVVSTFLTQISMCRNERNATNSRNDGKNKKKHTDGKSYGKNGNKKHYDKTKSGQTDNGQHKKHKYNGNNSQKGNNDAQRSVHYLNQGNQEAPQGHLGA